MFCRRFSQQMIGNGHIRSVSSRCFYRRQGFASFSTISGGCRLSTPAVSRGRVGEKRGDCLMNATYIIPLCQVSSSSYPDHEGSRVSKAYLGNNLGIAPQKHDGNRLIYEVRGQAMLRFVTLSFYTTAAVGLYLAPDFISSALENDAINNEAIINLSAVSFAVIGLPSLLYMMSKRLVLKLYHNEARETYTAVTQSLILTNRFTKFALQDVVVKEKKSLLSHLFNLTTFKAKKTPLHVNSYNFKLPSDYNHLLGYDRDLFT